MRYLKFLFLLLVIVSTAAFQVISPLPEEAVDPNLQISWPPPIYTLRGPVEIRGTVNVANVSSYFLEFRPLNPDFTVADIDLPWSPATLPAQVPVIDDVIGTWNTEVVPDGVYELRLTVNVVGGTPMFARVSPLRIENMPPPFAITPTPVVIPTLVPQQSVPTLIPTPTAFNLTPEAVALTNANVRQGDNIGYPTVGSLSANERVPVIGRSNSGSGWWVVRLPNGREGFVAPSVVNVTGDTSGLPRINPPATPTPIASPTPPLPDAVLVEARFDRDITEGESFNIIVVVRNNSGVALPEFSVVCRMTPQDEFFSTFVEGLGANQQIDVSLTARLDEGGDEQTTARCAVDLNNLIPEISEDNNFYNVSQNLDLP